MISFRIDLLDLLAVQGTLKSLLQYHSSKASILLHSAFFIVQLSHSCMTTGKTIALTRRTFVGKVMSLLFNMLSMLVITFLPRSRSLLISWLQSPSAVILEPLQMKSATVSPSIFHKVMGSDVIIFVFWLLSFKPTFSLSFCSSLVCKHPLDHGKSKRVPEKYLFLLYWLCQSLWLCGPQSTVENSERDGNTRPPDMPLEKFVCRSGSNS